MLYEDDRQAAAADDPYEPTQTEQATQPQTQSQSQAQPEQWNKEIWGKLLPLFANGQIADFYKTKTVIRIGRGSNCDLKLSGIQISNEHCTIRWDEVHDEVILKDTSRNGTYVSATRVGKGTSTYLTDGAEIVFGQGGRANTDDFRYIFRYNAKTPPEGLYKEYDVGNELGRGSFATVRKGIRKSDAMDVAIKTIHKSRLQASSKTSEQSFFREVEIMKSLVHPNICKLYETFHDKLSVYLVLEFCSGGDLLDYIVKLEGLSEEIARYFTYQIVDAMSYVHQNNIAHRDLKPENVLLTNGQSAKRGLPVAKIADFGLAKALDGATKFKTMCGTPLYLAPEVVLKTKDDPYTVNVDSWSVGVIVFCMLANCVPFQDDDTKDINERFKNRRPDFTALKGKNISRDCYDFLLRMLDHNPRTRMTCTQALSHPWLKKEREAHDADVHPRPPDDGDRKVASSSRLQQTDFSMLANAGSYIDAEEEAAFAALHQNMARGFCDNDEIARTAQSMVQEDSIDEIAVPTPSQGQPLERRTMEMFKEDDELGSYQYITEEDMLRDASPVADNHDGPSNDNSNLKRKERSEVTDQDFEMGRASDNSDNSMATTPVSGNDALTPTEERNLRPRSGNKRSKC